MSYKLARLSEAEQNRDLKRFIEFPNRIEEWGACKWPEIFYEDCKTMGMNPIKGEFLYPPYTEKLLRDLSWRVNSMTSHFYIGICGIELRIGKTETSLALGWMFDPHYSLENLVYTRRELAVLTAKRKRKFCFSWDEPQIDIDSHEYKEYAAELRHFFETQARNQISGIYSLPYIKNLYFGARELCRYLIYLTYRCKFHIHGYVWSRGGWNPTEEFRMIGRFTFPKPDPNQQPELVSIIEKYRKFYKEPHVERMQDDFKLAFLKGGKDASFAEICKNDFLRARERDPRKKFTRGFVQWWIQYKLKEQYPNEDFSRRREEKLYHFVQGQLASLDALMEEVGDQTGPEDPKQIP